MEFHLLHKSTALNWIFLARTGGHSLQSRINNFIKDKESGEASTGHCIAHPQSSGIRGLHLHSLVLTVVFGPQF
jgi:hypothetical protein